MNILNSIITYVRRIIKTPSNSTISNNLIVDYINRFWVNDVDARIQLFDLKTKYQFQTSPAVDQYNMPLYNIQQSVDGDPQDQISYYPVYQGFMSPAYVNGVEVPFYTQRSQFFNLYPNVVQNVVQVGTGDGTAGPYTLQIPLLSPVQSFPVNPPVNAILRGHVDLAGVIANSAGGNIIDPPLATDELSLLIPTTSVFPTVYFTSTSFESSNIVVCDSGQFLEEDQHYGLLMEPGSAPFGNRPLGDGVNSNLYGYQLNTINYVTGQAIVRFNEAIPDGEQINCQCYYFQTGLPRSLLFYNNIITLRSPPDRQYLVELDAYLTPAAYLTTGSAIQYAYMSEYIARGAARKILSDTGDVEQMQFYEPLFREQEMLVWKRSQRQFTSTRTPTIYSTGPIQGIGGCGTYSTPF